ncbi:two-component system, chemotaxis family, sensor kinase CheA [Methylobacterium sp. 190mf]|uniref:hybrid sensor histidine kinase/response regulator n=1 Tax=Methylobacterium sp. 190mf TaxID=1761798 RepID=UPI00089F36DF|nr:response regulator [Methylobacterium sp. 190mf]SEG69414.1 two-component system, chemotaxis family, sensor kinase CheA [Methylobacterium sp. 190mf]
MAEDIRKLLLAAFDVEHREHVAAIRGALGSATPDWNDVFRRAHSLKGASRAVDLPAVEAVAHRLETLFEGVRTGATALDREAANAVHLALDRIESYVAGLTDGSGPDMPADALAALGHVLRLPGETPLPAQPAPPAAPPPAPLPDPSPSPPPGPPAAPASPPAATAAPTQADPAPKPGSEPPEASAAILRVPAEAVEALARASHDLASTLAGQAPAADGLARLARLARDLRVGAEALAAGAGAERPEWRALAARAGAFAREAADLSRRQASATSAVEGAATRVRAAAERLALVPAETVLAPLARSLRETAREQGREVDLTLRGLDLPVERGTLQALKDPLLHALRNALSHGWQAPEVRRAAGKPEALGLGLEVAVRGARLHVTVFDDGPGPDLARIESAARERGLLGPASAAEPDTLLRLVFEPGFSTAEAVDTLSGRGYGLSVAADAARQLMGSVRLEPRDPAGTALIFSLPLSAARRSLLLVEAAGRSYALPGGAVERLLRLRRDDLPVAMGRTIVRLGDGDAATSHPVTDLAAILGQVADPADPGTLTAVVLRTGGGRLALAVDRLHDVRPFLVLPAPDFGADPGLIAGTAVLNGDVPVLVLDPEGLASRAQAGTTGGALGTMAPAPRSTTHAAAAASARATILVVDDSITTRTLEKGILEAAGYRVVVCVDGQDALDRLRAEIEPVNLVLADVEMPRLDGFGLLKALRADERFARLPAILMTSRGDAADVARGLDLGADAYLTKQKFDQRQLLDTIGQLL